MNVEQIGSSGYILCDCRCTFLGKCRRGYGGGDGGGSNRQLLLEHLFGSPLTLTWARRLACVLSGRGVSAFLNPRPELSVWKRADRGIFFEPGGSPPGGCGLLNAQVAVFSYLRTRYAKRTIQCASWAVARSM